MPVHAGADRVPAEGGVVAGIEREGRRGASAEAEGAGARLTRWILIALVAGIAVGAIVNATVTDPTPLVEAFLAKREHRGLVEAMPLHVVTAEDLGLRGALVCAAR